MSDTAETKIPTAKGLLDLASQASSVSLCHFRTNHDMCLRSGFFPKETLLKVDQCALGFRTLGLDTVTVARLTSNMWINTVISFYENIGVIDTQEDQKAMFDKLGGQAQKLGKIYAVIAAWARKLSGKIDEACNDALAASDEFTREYRLELAQARRILKNAQEELQDKKDELEDARDTRDDYKTALIASTAAIILGPIGLAIGFGISGSGYAAAVKAVNSAREAEEQAENDVAQAQEDFQAAADRTSKAKKIARVTVTLVKTLSYMEKITDEIATFWTKESNNFITQASKMIANEKEQPTALIKAIAPKDIAFWKQSMQDFDDYVEVMTRIMNLYNYTNEASPVPVTTLLVAELAFSMHIPSYVDVASIMDD